MIKRLEGIQKGQKVYVVPSDSRCKPQWAEVYSVGPKNYSKGYDPRFKRV